MSIRALVFLTFWKHTNNQTLVRRTLCVVRFNKPIICNQLKSNIISKAILPKQLPYLT